MKPTWRRSHRSKKRTVASSRQRRHLRRIAREAARLNGNRMPADPMELEREYFAEARGRGL